VEAATTSRRVAAWQRENENHQARQLLLLL
jgi:hypothetical protein